MFSSRLLRTGALVTLVALLAIQASAERMTQVIDLHPGWNAVYLDVQPDSSACEDVFAGIPVQSVWTWNPRFPTAQYVRDASDLLPELPQWLTYYPPNNAQAALLKDLYAIHGGRSYLIELGGTQGVSLTVTGNRNTSAKKWMPDSFNLMGFHIDPNALPSVQSFFAPAPAHAGQPVYRLSSAGKWVEVTGSTVERIQPGTAYWVYSKGESTYTGPVSVTFDGRGGLHYGLLGSEQSLVLQNDSDQIRTVWLRLRPSDRPTVRAVDSGPVSYGGEVVLAYYNLLPKDVGSKSRSWARFDEATSFVLPPRSKRKVILAVRRSEMSEPRSADDVYESVLDIYDGGGSLYSVPVSAQKSLGRGGLWVGTVTVDGVSEAGNPNDSETATAVASPFRFRIIVHRDSQGLATLLHHVLFLELAGQLDAVPPVEARTVLITRDELIPQFIDLATVDGKVNGRRISAPVFSIPPEASSPEVEIEGSNVLSWTVTIPFDDPLNPFVHRYHPDHDNLDDRYEEKLSEGKESFTVERTITLTFNFDELIDAAVDELNPENPDDIYSLLDPEIDGNMYVGRYREVIDGVHRNPIIVEGGFNLHLVSLEDTLNDGE